VIYHTHTGTRTLSSDLRRSRIYQEKCKNCIGGTWKPQRKGRTGSHWEFKDEHYFHGTDEINIKFSELF
jgi:hypothetical protein